MGFAKLLRNDSSASMSASGGLIGTPAYMAPEIWRGKRGRLVRRYLQRSLHPGRDADGPALI